MNGTIAIGLGAVVLVWAAVTLFEGLALGGIVLAVIGGALVWWGLKQRGRR